MGTFSLMHWIVVVAVVLIVFGAGRLPTAMGDLAKGMKAFRDGLRDESGDDKHAARLNDRKGD